MWWLGESRSPFTVTIVNRTKEFKLFSFIHPSMKMLSVC